jgi:hypothetical protein
MFWMGNKSMALTEGNKAAPKSEQSEPPVRNGLDIEVWTWFLLKRQAGDHHRSGDASCTTYEAGDANSPAKPHPFEKTLKDDRIDNATYLKDRN